MTPRSSYLKSSSRRLLICRTILQVQGKSFNNLCSGLIVILVLRKLTRFCRFSERIGIAEIFLSLSP